jgi:O-antigen ligase
MTTASTTTRLPLRQTVPTQEFPPWAIAFIGLVTLALAITTFIGDQFAVMAAALSLALIAGTVVFYRPDIGILIIMSTMLISYPSALKGVGPLTINNLLGASLVCILGFQVYREHNYWFLREPEIRLLLIIATMLIFGQMCSWIYLPFHVKAMLPKVEYGHGAGLYGTVDSSDRWVFELLSRIAFTIFFVNWIRTAKQMRLSLLILGLCILAVIPSIGFDSLKGSADATRISSKLVGWAENPNRFAFMVNVGVALFVYLANIYKSFLFKVVMLVGSVLCIPLVMMSASRSGFLGLGIVGMMLLWGEQIPKHWKIIAASGGIVFGLVVFLFVLRPETRERLLNLNPFNTQSHDEGSRSTEVRVATLGEALEIIKMYPITGIGLGNFRWVNMWLHGSWKPPHNSYVWSWSEGGIFCTALYFTLFAFLYARIERIRPKFKDHPVLPYMPDFLHLYFVLFIFFSIFADVWLEVHIYFLVSMSIVLSRWAEDAELRGRGLPGAIAGTPGERRAAVRALYRREQPALR